MMMARGLAFMITGGFSIYQVPKSLTWLGQGTTLRIPNTVILLVVLYAAAHVFVSRTRMGRYIYAVGGNEEAARLSGVPVRLVIAFDASPAGKQAVFEKKLYDSPQQFPRRMATGTVEAFIKYLDGEEFEKKVFIPCEHYYYEDSVSDERRVAEQW